MRILSLAIIGTLCLGMMPCAQTADSKDERAGAVVISCDAAAIVPHPPARIHRTADANRQAEPRKRLSSGVFPASIIRGKSKVVLISDGNEAQADVDPTAQATQDTAQVTTGDTATRATVQTAHHLDPLPADIDTSAIRLVAAIDDFNDPSIALAAMEPSRSAERGCSPGPTNETTQWNARPRTHSTAGRAFAPLVTLPSLPAGAIPMPALASQPAIDQPVAKTESLAQSQPLRRSPTRLVAETLPLPEAKSAIGTDTAVQPKRRVIANLPGGPKVPTTGGLETASRQRRTSGLSRVAPIAGKTPTPIPVARPSSASISKVAQSSGRNTRRDPLADLSTRVPDAPRPDASSRGMPAPEPVGSMPHPLEPSPVTFQPSTSTRPRDIGNIHAIKVAPANKDRRKSEPNINVQRVVHHAERDADEHGEASEIQIADLIVGSLPQSTRRVAQVVAQSDDAEVLTAPVELTEPPANRKGFAIPLKPVPGTDRATLEKHNDLVTLVANDAELRSVLRMIADHHKLNLVIGPDVAGPVTVSIRGARLDEVLDAILGVAGFHWHQSGNLLYVTGSDSATLDPKVQGRRLQVYPLNYVAASDVQTVVTGLLSPIGTAYTSEADALDQLKTRELLIVEDNEAGHVRVSQYIAQVDIPPRQVLVEAHVLQIDLSDEERHGVNLRALARVAGAKVVLEGTGFAEESPDGPSMAFRIDSTDVGHLIEAIHVNTNSRTLASPKVSVVNRQTAKVQIGQRLPYAVATTTQTATIQNVQFLDVGIVLEVTPVITQDGNILMTVLPKVSGGKITDSGFPEEDTTQVSTTVLMPDGSGLVIGGLIRETDSESDANVPVLGKIPVIKRLFNKRAAESRRNELVVALVTHIMHDPNPVREKECRDLQTALPNHAASELRYAPEIRYSNH